MRFGGQTVTFVAVSDSGDPGFLGLKAQTRTETPVEGCHFRPLSAQESVDVVDVSTSLWKATCPPVPAALAAEPDGELVVDGVTYQIVGPPMPKVDLSGETDHVTVVCKRQIV
ncbi:MAG: hypothetical protein IPM06_19340 [Rhizobiales bacterium]|jgi:hypothetical protein|nr:hypothetical protein [Hyphomicrobiales bacterium]